MIPDDLPKDMPAFIARFGSDEQCRDYLFKARWPDGFRCATCGHGDAYKLQTKIVYECAACGKQHSLLAGTIFEQTKTGLARWFLAIYLVTSSKGGIAAAELQRQMAFGSYQTAWSWLHKIRTAMVRPDRAPLSGRVEADETYLGGPKPGKPGRGAAGKTMVAGAVEAGRGEHQGRRLGRLRLAALRDASARSLEGFLDAAAAKLTTVVTDGWRSYTGLPAKGYGHDGYVNEPWPTLLTNVGPRCWAAPLLMPCPGCRRGCAGSGMTRCRSRGCARGRSAGRPRLGRAAHWGRPAPTRRRAGYW